jgi:cytochrome P450
MTFTSRDDPRLNPFPWYRQMRERHPVSFVPQRGGWGVFRFDDVQEVLSNYALYSSQLYGDGPPQASQPIAASMISIDPPRHRQLRSLVTQAFTPRAIEALAPRIAAIVDELLEPALAAGQFDAIHGLGEPLPVIAPALNSGPTPSCRWRAAHRSPPSPPSARWSPTSPRLLRGAGASRATT